MSVVYDSVHVSSGVVSTSIQARYAYPKSFGRSSIVFRSGWRSELVGEEAVVFGGEPGLQRSLASPPFAGPFDRTTADDDSVMTGVVS